MKLRNVISLFIVSTTVFSAAAAVKGCAADYTLWAHGETAVLQPITEYSETHVNKQGSNEVAYTYYTANIQGKLASGRMVTIEHKPLSLARIKASLQPGETFTVVPDDPDTMRFADEGSITLMSALMACVLGVIGFYWFRYLGSED